MSVQVLTKCHHLRYRTNINTSKFLNWLTYDQLGFKQVFSCCSRHFVNCVRTVRSGNLMDLKLSDDKQRFPGTIISKRCISKTITQPVIKPLENLQRYCKTPLLPKDQLLFDPSEKEIRRAQNLFLPGQDHKIEFLKSALFTEQLPEYDLPEVAFIGRSNVGKSSLIQMLLSGVKGLEVRISSSPGHTKTLNFFKVGEKFSVVDMAGYGHKMPKNYVETVETFLHSRQKLCRTFFMVDSEVGVSKTDVIGLNMLEEFQISYVIVMTKIDKARPAKLIKNFMSVLEYRDKTNYCFQQPFLVSSVQGDGVALLQAFIAYVTGNFSPAEG